ncbi:hypothetical protein OF83DRAFT_1296195 [Amylostereum chailletii]|nr:hypothetical protein OF83DRAFT_1296195 [Amylostereum chailletii]
MQPFQNEEDFRFDAESNLWTCLRCGVHRASQARKNAIAHEKSAMHQQAVEQYLRGLKAANLEDDQDAARTSYVPHHYDNPADDPFDPAFDTPRHPFSHLSLFDMDQECPRGDFSREVDPSSARGVDASGRSSSGASSSPQYSPTHSHIHPSAPPRSRAVSEHDRGRLLVQAALNAFHGHRDDVSPDRDTQERTDSGSGFLPRVRGQSAEPVTNIPDSGHTSNRRSRRQQDFDNYWNPWESRVTCSLDIIAHLPRTMFSDADMEVLLWLLVVNGVNGVPSISQLKASSALLDGLCGIEIRRCMGKHGHVFYLNTLSSIIKQEMSNPLVRPHIWFYPAKLAPGELFSDAFHADRWLYEIHPSLLTPMHRHENDAGKLEDFFIHEPTLLRDGHMCMPVRWYTVAGIMCTQAYIMTPELDTDGMPCWVVNKAQEVCIKDTDLLLPVIRILGLEDIYHMPDVSKIKGLQMEDDSMVPWQHPIINPLRTKAKGYRVVSLLWWLYCDDTSGNRSKKWNEHNSFLTTLAGLPQEHVQNAYNVHFLCTSNIASPLEMLDGVVEDIELVQENGIFVYDCLYREMVLVITGVLALLGDNPMQSEFSCHVGLRGKFFCQCCWAYGYDADENTIDSESNQPSSNTSASSDSDSPTTKTAPRYKKSETLGAMIKRMTRALTLSRPRRRNETMKAEASVLNSIQQMQSHAEIKSSQTRTGVKDTFFNAQKHKRGVAAENAMLRELQKIPRFPFSPVWRIKGLDPHSDTPVEILHVVLLGCVKYFWRDAINNRMSDEQKEIVKIRLSSLDVSGLGPEIASLVGHTLVQYAGSLVGRDFRIIIQIAVFVLYDIVEPDVLAAWVALCRLVPLIWQPSITKTEEYLVTLQNAVDKFLLTTAKWSTRWFNKPKFHLLLHLPDHVRRFGPAILFATEVFEAFNAVIRGWCIHSNRLAPSRDAAVAAAEQKRVRHLASGGYYCIPEHEDEFGQHFDECWVTIGPGPTEILSISSVVTKRLGIKSKPMANTGHVRNILRRPHVFLNTLAAEQPMFQTLYQPETRFTTWQIVDIANGDHVRVQGFIALDPKTLHHSALAGDQMPVICKVLEIAVYASQSDDHITRGYAEYLLVQQYSVGSNVEPYNMPSIQESPTIYVVSPSTKMRDAWVIQQFAEAIEPSNVDDVIKAVQVATCTNLSLWIVRIFLCSTRICSDFTVTGSHRPETSVPESLLCLVLSSLLALHFRLLPTLITHHLFPPFMDSLHPELLVLATLGPPVLMHHGHPHGKGINGAKVPPATLLPVARLFQNEPTTNTIIKPNSTLILLLLALQPVLNMHMVAHVRHRSGHNPSESSHRYRNAFINLHRRDPTLQPVLNMHMVAHVRHRSGHNPSESSHRYRNAFINLHRRDPSLSRRDGPPSTNDYPNTMILSETFHGKVLRLPEQEQQIVLFASTLAAENLAQDLKGEIQQTQTDVKALKVAQSRTWSVDKALTAALQAIARDYVSQEDRVDFATVWKDVEAYVHKNADVYGLTDIIQHQGNNKKLNSAIKRQCCIAKEAAQRVILSNVQGDTVSEQLLGRCAALRDYGESNPDQLRITEESEDAEDTASTPAGQPSTSTQGRKTTAKASGSRKNAGKSKVPPFWAGFEKELRRVQDMYKHDHEGERHGYRYYKDLIRKDEQLYGEKASHIRAITMGVNFDAPLPSYSTPPELSTTPSAPSPIPPSSPGHSYRAPPNARDQPSGGPRSFSATVPSTPLTHDPWAHSRSGPPYAHMSSYDMNGQGFSTASVNPARSYTEHPPFAFATSS